MHTTHNTLTLKTLAALRTNLLTLVAITDTLTDLIENQPEVPVVLQPERDQARPVPLKIDRALYSVHWREKSCVLGCTTGFRLLERLARRPNEYVSTDRLLEELWAGSRTYSTVRSTVCRLRLKLQDSGLEDLAECIDGRVQGHYALMIRDP
jgi:DNA-binding response OmpR family regulator